LIYTPLPKRTISKASSGAGAGGLGAGVEEGKRGVRSLEGRMEEAVQTMDTLIFAEQLEGMAKEYRERVENAIEEEQEPLQIKPQDAQKEFQIAVERSLKKTQEKEKERTRNSSGRGGAV
jgi:hypothetical protein